MNILDRATFHKLTSHHRPKEENNYWHKKEQLRWIIRLFVLTAVLFAARVAMPVCATAMAQEFGWNKADLGVAMGTFFWGYVTTQVIGGYMADKVGGDKVLCLSVSIWGILTVLTPHIAHIHFDFMSVLCGGIGSIILEHRSWEVVFYIIGITAIICAYSLFIVIQQPKNKVISIDSMVYSYPNALSHSSSVPWRSIFSKPPVWSLIFAHICMNNCFYIMLSWLPTFFHDFFPHEKGWVYNVIPWAMSIPASVLGGWLSDKLIKSKFDIGFTRKTMQIIAMAGSGFFASLLPYCTQFSHAVLCAGVAVSVLTFHHSGVLVNPQDIAPKYAGSVFGVMNAFGAIPGFIGVYCTGYILNATNSWAAVFIVMAVVNIIGVTVFTIWGTGKPIV